MRIIILLLSCCFIFSCSPDKVTEVTITNKNAYPINLKITTNNISQTFSLKPQETITDWYKWNGLDEKDGQWIFTVQNDNTKGVDEFAHGYFTNGTLYNYLTLISQGDQLKVEVSE